jgi:hypothetical protein
MTSDDRERIVVKGGVRYPFLALAVVVFVAAVPWVAGGPSSEALPGYVLLIGLAALVCSPIVMAATWFRCTMDGQGMTLRRFASRRIELRWNEVAGVSAFHYRGHGPPRRRGKNLRLLLKNGDHIDIDRGTLGRQNARRIIEGVARFRPDLEEALGAARQRVAGRRELDYESATRA